MNTNYPAHLDVKFQEIVAEHGTPCWAYDIAEIDKRIDALKQFGTIRYAQKANSNIHILSHLRDRGIVVDAVSAGEIQRAFAAGYTASADTSEIVYASDILDAGTLELIVKHAIPVNVGSPQMLSQVGEVSPKHRVWLRINPGFGSGFSRKTNTGGEYSKHGIWHENLDECYELIKQHDLHLVGLHMHIGSGAESAKLQRVCDAMVAEVKRCPFDLEAISTGGGLPITHRADDVEFDVQSFFDCWSVTKKEIEQHLGHDVHLEIEPGRYIVGNSGYLLSEVRAKKDVGPNKFVLLDAGFNELVRPAMYGGYHKINILHRGDGSHGNQEFPTIVAGPLCEAGDVFTQDAEGMVEGQQLPDCDVGDLAIFEDCGAYSASMSSNYNSRTLAPEILINGSEHKLIRRRQEFDDLLKLEIE